MPNQVDETLADRVVVERLIRGREKVDYISPSTRWATVRRLHQLKWSDGQIALRVRCSRKNVLFIRRRMGLAPNYQPGARNPAWRVNVPTLHHREN
jgi:hypothetical protein